MMKYLFWAPLLLISQLSCAASSTSFIRGVAGVTGRGAVFGVPRGGGLFGGGNKEDKKYVRFVLFL